MQQPRPDQVVQDENVLDESIQDMVERFLLGERRVLEKEAEGEPVAGQREPTRGRFALVDQLYEEHGRSPMSPEQLSARLAALRGAEQSDQRQQASEMFGRWEEFQLLGEPVPRRDDPYAARPDPGYGDDDPRAKAGA
jgi:hypothetical protein